nr:hypothetical protein [Tanacetum cinerariifolium]
TPSIGFRRPFGCHVTILNTLDPLSKFDGKADEGFLVGYSVSSKAFRVFNSKTKIIQETLHINFLENQPNVTGSGRTWLFDIDTLTQSMNYQPVVVGNQPNTSTGIQEHFNADKAGEGNVQQYVLFPLWSTGSKDPQNTDVDATFEVKEPESEVHISPSSSAKTKKHDDKTKREAKGKNLVEFSPVTAVGPNSTNSTNTFSTADMPILEDIAYSDDEKDVGAEADFSNLEINITVNPIPTTRVHKDHHVTQIIDDLSSALQTRSMTRMVKDQDERGIVVRNKARLVAQGHTQDEGIDYKEVFAPVARIEAVRLFLAYDSFMGFMVYQMDVKSAFLYGTIEEEVYVCQPPGFKDPDYPDKVYVDDIIFGSTNKELCKAFEKLMKDKFQKSSMGELTFFLELQVKQKEDRIFISQDKYNIVAISSTEAEYVADVLKRLEKKRKLKALRLKRLRKAGTAQRVESLADTVIDDQEDASKQGEIAELDANEDITLETVDVQGRLLESQVLVYHLDLEHAQKVLSMQETDEAEPAKVEEVIEVVTAAKLMTEVVTITDTTTTTITAALVPKASALRKRRGVIIQDPEKAATASVSMQSEVKSKDKGKGILVEEPKPLKRQAQIEQDEAFARELEAELNANINWNDVIEQVKRKERQDNTVMRYQSLKRKPVTEAHARKNMMVYLKNMVVFKMDFFKKKRKARKAREKVKILSKKQLRSKRIDEETEELKTHLQIIPNDEDDVYTEATPLALKVHVIDYQIHIEHNKHYYKIIRADGTHQLFLSLISLLSNFDREDLEMLWKIVQERFKSSKPKNFSDDFLLNALKTMFEKPNVADSVCIVSRASITLLASYSLLPYYIIKKNHASNKTRSKRRHDSRIHSSYDRSGNPKKLYPYPGRCKQNSGGGPRRPVQPARVCSYTDFMKCQPLNFRGTEGVLGLSCWVGKMESVFHISVCAVENQVKFATYTMLDAALTWWNGHVRTLGHDVAYAMTWETFKKKLTDKYCPKELTLMCTKFLSDKTEKVDKYISGLPDNIHENVMSARPKTLNFAIELANDLMDQKLRTYAERQAENKRKLDNNNQDQQQLLKKQNVVQAYAVGSGEKKPYEGSKPLCPKCNYHHDGECAPKCTSCKKVCHLTKDCWHPINDNNQRTITCYEYGNQGYYMSD